MVKLESTNMSLSFKMNISGPNSKNTASIFPGIFFIQYFTIFIFSCKRHDVITFLTSPSPVPWRQVGAYLKGLTFLIYMI